MKKGNGFTLVELIAVIIILAVTLTLAVATVTKVLDKNKEKALEAKEKLILKQAKEYILDNDSLLFNSTKSYGDYVCYVFTVDTLVTNGYLDEDDNSTNDLEKDVINPKTKESMKGMKILAYIKSSNSPTSPDYNVSGKYIGNVITIFDESAEENCQ